jgi:hypothetical protein
MVQGARLDAGCNIIDGISKGGDLAVVFFRDLDPERFVNPLNPPKHVHRIEVELVPKVRVVLDLLIRDLGSDIG